jgi:hypothetical protein
MSKGQIEAFTPAELAEKVREMRICHHAGCGSQTIRVLESVPASLGHTIKGPLLDTWGLDLPADVIDDLDLSMVGHGLSALPDPVEDDSNLEMIPY